MAGPGRSAVAPLPTGGAELHPPTYQARKGAYRAATPAPETSPWVHRALGLIEREWYAPAHLAYRAITLLPPAIDGLPQDVSEPYLAGAGRATALGRHGPMRRWSSEPECGPYNLQTVSPTSRSCSKGPIHS